MQRLLYIAIVALLPVSISAKIYLSANFNLAMPKDFTLVNANDAELSSSSYLHISNPGNAAWTVAQMPDGYGRSAIAQTRNADPAVPADKWMIMPALDIDEPGAVLRWQARSLLRHVPESYRVAVRVAGTETWTDVFVCEAESYEFAYHVVSLGQFTGSSIEIAFVATTARGFILAVDNVMVGVPDDNAYTFTSHTPHYVGVSASLTVGGELAYYGSASPWSQLVLTGAGDEQRIDLPGLGCGDRVDVAFELTPVLGETYDYTLSAVAADGTSTVIYRDFVSCSYYARTQLVNHFTATWCNNCPHIDISIDHLRRLYGEEMIIADVHVQDIMTDEAYWSSFWADRIFAIPALVPNQQDSKIVYTLKPTDNLSASLLKETIAAIACSATVDADGNVSVDTETRFALDTDNGADRYRLGAMVIADIHDAHNMGYLQHNSTLAYTDGTPYYMAGRIMPELMYYDNVVVASASACTGIPRSLPAVITAGATSACTISIPTTPAADRTNLRAVAVIIDTADMSMVNCAVCPVTEGASVTDIYDESGEAAVYYDLQGRCLGRRPASGYCIEQRGQHSRIVRCH